jgi:enoyl-CoA hydratase/carnithine racemase
MDSFTVDVTSGIATVTLNRPDKLNALLPETYEGLRDFFGGLKKEPSIHAVVLTGSGRGFCSGGDVREMVGALAGAGPAKLARFARLQNVLAANIRSAPQPVLAAVNGVALGGGAALAVACDLRLGSPAATVTFSFPGLAAADMGVSWLLPRIVGLGRAADWLLTGREIGADEALAAGLLSRIVPGEILVAEARTTALRIADGPREALAATKRLLDSQFALPFPKALEAENKVQAALLSRPDFVEACRSFVERRSPRYNRS